MPSRFNSFTIANHQIGSHYSLILNTHAQIFLNCVDLTTQWIALTNGNI